MTTDPHLQNAIVAILDSLPSLIGSFAALAAALAAYLSSRANAKKLDHNTAMTQAVSKKLDENTEITKQIVASSTGSHPVYTPDSKQGDDRA